MRILITGGAGFIGSNLVRRAMGRGHEVICYDALTYAGNLASLADLDGRGGFTFVRGDIRDSAALTDAFSRYEPDAVMNLAAESHVDRSIDGPGEFIETNVVGTFRVLEACRARAAAAPGFRLLHVSTDEVFGSLGPEGYFSEGTAYDPSSPYSASKAASDHLVRAWGRTYGLPAIITNCSNNYGPYQFPEKLIPHIILSALGGRELPVYGDGMNVRDWIYVDDHCDALLDALERGEPGETYTIGASSERTNIFIVRTICGALDRLRPRDGGARYEELIKFVTDRPGHDRRYAIDSSKARRELGWRPAHTFDEGMAATIEWYLANEAWAGEILSGDYRLRRIGIGGAA